MPYVPFACSAGGWDSRCTPGTRAQRVHGTRRGLSMLRWVGADVNVHINPPARQATDQAT